MCVNEEANRFYCFGCGAKGNIINWIQKIDNISFHDAVKKAADYVGVEPTVYIESKTTKILKEIDELYKTKKKDVNTNRTILNFQNDYRRKFSDEKPEEWIREGISTDELDKYEIMVDNSSNRIVYPVYDNEFRLIGVKGRTRFKNYKELKLSKYMNYYSLGVVDYFAGMKQAVGYILNSKSILITEGIKSVMKIDAWGFHNCVASETSALNEHQIELLIKMHLKNVIIAYDKDVKLDKIKKMLKDLKMFCNVFAVIDHKNLLDEKMSPCDKGYDVWEQLYKERIKL